MGSKFQSSGSQLAFSNFRDGRRRSMSAFRRDAPFEPFVMTPLHVSIQVNPRWRTPALPHLPGVTGVCQSRRRPPIRVHVLQAVWLTLHIHGYRLPGVALKPQDCYSSFPTHSIRSLRRPSHPTSSRCPPIPPSNPASASSHPTLYPRLCALPSHPLGSNIVSVPSHPTL